MRVCVKQHIQKIHTIVNSPEYQGQDIYLEEDAHLEGHYNVFSHEEEGAS